MEHPTPDGFKPLFRTSPFLDHNGPFFYGGGTFVAPGQPKHAKAAVGCLRQLLFICNGDASSMPAPRAERREKIAEQAT